MGISGDNELDTSQQTASCCEKGKHLTENIQTEGW